MKVYAQIILSRDGYIAGVGDDVSWISEKTRQQYSRTIRGMGNCIVGRRAYQSMERKKVILNGVKDPGAINNNLDSSTSPDKSGFAQNDQWSHFFDACNDPFVVVLSKHNYPSQPHRHFSHAKPKNILKLLDEKWYSSTVVCGGVEAIKLFIDAGLIDRLIVYREDVNVGEGLRFSEKLFVGWECTVVWDNLKIYSNIT